MKKCNEKHAGFTMIELMVTVGMAAIVMFGIAVAMADAHKGWNQMFERVHGEIVNDAYAARNAFDAFVRKASVSKFYISSDRKTVRVAYYSDDTDWELNVDRYAQFYFSGDQLLVDYGELSADGTVQSPTTTSVLANNVDYDNSGFYTTGRDVQMVLKLDNERESMTIVCSAVRHNE